jgi:predicted GNAT family N-acyltransferase/CRP-like cAMP-binding protein
VRYAVTAEEHAAVRRLRYAVYVAEMHTFDDVAHHLHRELVDAGDRHARILLAEADGAVAATIRLTFGRDAPFDAEIRQTYQLDQFSDAVNPAEMVVLSRFIVAPQYRGGALPGRLLEAAARLIYDENVEVAFCDCSPHLVRFYQRLGFRTYGRPYHDPHLALQIPLILVTNDVEHLARIGSPIAHWRPTRRWPSPVTRRVKALLAQLPELPSGEAARHHVGEPLPELLAVLTDEEQATLLTDSLVLRLQPGDCLIRRRQVLRTIYLVLAGTLEARDQSGQCRWMNRGDVVGEIAFLTGAERSRDVHAGRHGALVLSMPDSAIGPLAQVHDSRLGRLLHQTMAGRLGTPR